MADVDCLVACLEQAAREAGRSWAAGYREALRQDRRMPTGGWPGTLTEARAVAFRCVVTRGSGRAAGSLTAHEQEHFARLINASARSDWLNSASREAPSVEDLE